jgi:hypothetical protein
MSRGVRLDLGVRWVEGVCESRGWWLGVWVCGCVGWGGERVDTMKGLEVMNGLLICGFKSRTPHQSYAVIHNARKEKALGESRKN